LTPNVKIPACTRLLIVTEVHINCRHIAVSVTLLTGHVIQTTWPQSQVRHVVLAVRTPVIMWTALETPSLRSTGWARRRGGRLVRRRFTRTLGPGDTMS